MQYIDYSMASSNKKLDISNNIINLYNLLEENIESYKEYTHRSNKLLPSNHIMVRLCNCISNYFGSNPMETYDNLAERARYLCSMYGIGVVGNNADTSNLALGNDILIYVDVPSYKAFDGNAISKSYKAIRVFTHNALSVDPEYYKWDEASVANGDYSLMGINIPLLGAMMHTEYNEQVKRELDFNLNNFIVDKLIVDVVYDHINIGLMNRFSNDAMNGKSASLVYGDLVAPRPYNYRPVNPLYERATKDFMNHFKQIGSGTLADLNNNIPLLLDKDPKGFLPNFEDYYQDNLMWINAYAEVGQYKRLRAIKDSYKIRVDTSSVDRRLSLLLNPSRFNNFTMALPDALRNNVDNYVKL